MRKVLVVTQGKLHKSKVLINSQRFYISSAGIFRSLGCEIVLTQLQIWGLSLQERLEKLSLFSLARRRLRGDLILAYNLSNGSFGLPIEEFCTRPPCSSLRGHSLKLHHRWFRLNRRKAAFSVRIVEPWNKLPAFVVGSPSVEVFKSRLDGCWMEVYPDVI